MNLDYSDIMYNSNKVFEWEKKAFGYKESYSDIYSRHPDILKQHLNITLNSSGYDSCHPDTMKTHLI